jgi:hypothetical protein
MRTSTLASAAGALLLTGCFVQLGGELPQDGTVDPAPEPTGDSTGEVVPDAGPDGEPDGTVDPPDALDATDVTDVTTERDAIPEPPFDIPDVVPDPTDTVDESWECFVVYGDPACDDSEVCTADWCDLVTHTCVHSGTAMEDAACSSDGNDCTDDFCRGGVCVHTAYREGLICPDDGNICTADVCASGVCTHPSGPHDGDPCPDDGDICTYDECDSGSCTHPWITDCCHRDGDCIWSGHLWECDVSTHGCYDPPAGGFCADCDDREDCGDGGSGSDDWCVHYTYSDRGCSTDCADDYDCPRGSTCDDGSGSPCGGGTDCICVVKTGTCTTWNEFGTSCSHDYNCDGPDNFCGGGGRCTWSCTTDEDCPPQSPGCSGVYCSV